MDLKRKSKIFSRLALKEKMLLLKKIRSLKDVSKELTQTIDLSEKLEKLISNVSNDNLPENVSQLKAKKFYTQKIHEELSQICNRKAFLEKEALDIRLSTGKTKTKVNKALEKAADYKKLLEIELAEKF